MSGLFFFLILLACPLGMFFMMRGMHGGSDSHEQGHGRQIVDAAAVDARVADLEREVSRLRGEQADNAPSGSGRRT